MSLELVPVAERVATVSVVVKQRVDRPRCPAKLGNGSQCRTAVGVLTVVDGVEVYVCVRHGGLSSYRGRYDR